MSDGPHSPRRGWVGSVTCRNDGWCPKRHRRKSVRILIGPLSPTRLQREEGRSRNAGVVTA